ncbi:MAG: Stp1/IreP family PP2C-type Ser/Thr phosphatase [Clostridiales Family XIII bacterium]|jgi:protein phosphatase|nr:Stp1/IreP family PP2C-type Ser/Thr phosphatase [Clostridiales Family XIII bacterium]
MAHFGFRTDIGNKRQKNEDALLVLPKYNIYAVADGVGGLSSGEIASRKALGGIENFLSQNPLHAADTLEGKYRANWISGYFARAFQKINGDILSTSEDDPATAGMATTAVLCYLDVESLYIINIGDSRAYILREGELTQLTEDHTYVQDLVKGGSLSEADAKTHPQKNMITRALGVEKYVEPDFYRYDLQPKDRILLCSDGLHGEVPDEEIQSILEKGKDLNDICRELVDAANGAGGNDNITVVVVDNN